MSTVEINKNHWESLIKVFWKAFIFINLLFCILSFFLWPPLYVLFMVASAIVMGLNFFLLSFLCSVYTKQKKSSPFFIGIAFLVKLILWTLLLASAFLLPSSYMPPIILACLGLVLSLFFLSLYYIRLLRGQKPL